MFAGHWTRPVAVGCCLVAIVGFASTQPVGNDYERIAGKGALASDEGASSSRVGMPVDLDLHLYNPNSFQQHPPARTYSFSPFHPGSAPMLGAQPGVGAGESAVWTPSHQVPQHVGQEPQGSGVHPGPSLPVLSPPTEAADAAAVGQPWWEDALPKYATHSQVYERWTQALRTILGNPYLQFTSVGDEEGSRSRVVVARDRLLRADRLVPPAAGERMLWGSLKAEKSDKKAGLKHFLYRLHNAQAVKMGEMTSRATTGRTYVYLDSRFNMDWYNHMYFGNRLRFIPIRAEGMSWRTMNNLFMRRRFVLALPSLSPNGLPLLVGRHTFQNGMHEVQDFFPDGLEDPRQIVSLWSPALHGMDRTTMVLYGIGQLDMRDDPQGGGTVKRLEAIAQTAQGTNLKTNYDILTELPHILA
ncbi:hypothetical protein PaG_06522 [Moesziomyces aphidis]|uniref:Uncharacterized protein n=1 Tax=Moesziomyces aphidis TaxID=84754 RepID=W3VD72_MOEAP|nr:hypothetical protein PaG_06522 [Moesziomyces aphidis]